MKTKLLLIALVCSISMLAKSNLKPENYYSASCNKSICMLSRPEISFYGDSLLIYDCVNANCCAKFELTVSDLVNDTLTVTFQDTATMLCTCDCNHSVVINAGEVSSKNIVIKYDGETYPLNAKKILPMIEDGKSWNVETMNLTMGPLPVTGQYIVKSNSERAFCWNGKFYTRINKNYIIALKSGTDTPEDIYIREYNGKVYYMQDSTECREILIYDFSLNPEDSVTVGDSNNNLIKLKVDSVKYIQYEESITRKTLYLSGDGNRTWIEGIGDINYPFNYWLPAPDNRCKCGESPYDKLICCSLNSDLLYRSPDYSSCIVISSATDSEYHFSIYPNPAKTYIKVDGIKNIGLNYSITDLSGSTVLNGQLSEEIMLNIPEGMYFISISDDKGIIGTEKLIIENCK